MKRLVKLLAVVLAAALVTVVFAACGSTPNQGQPSAQAEPDAAPSGQEPQAPADSNAGENSGSRILTI